LPLPVWIEHTDRLTVRLTRLGTLDCRSSRSCILPTQKFRRAVRRLAHERAADGEGAVEDVGEHAELQLGRAEATDVEEL
jgi:hypothetical protein